MGDVDLKLNGNRESNPDSNPEKPGGRGLLFFLFYLMFLAYAFIAIKVILFKTIPLSALFHSGIEPALRSVNIIPFNTIIDFFTK